MNKLHRTAGETFATVEIGGKKYTLRPLLVGDYATLDAHIVASRPDLLALTGQACAKVPQDQHAAMWRAAQQTLAERPANATQEELAAFTNSLQGQAFAFWRQARRDHAEIDSAEKAFAVLQRAADEELLEMVLEKMDSVSGEGDLGNCSGLETEATT